MSNKYVLIHCKPTLEDYLTKNNIEWSFSDVHGNNEIDVIVDDVEYKVIDGYYQDPDQQLCEHYGIDYDLVNCIEALWITSQLVLS